MLSNLGQIATIFMRLTANNELAHADVDAWGAPSECHSDVSRGHRRECVQAVSDIEQRTGYTPAELLEEFESRCGGKWLWQNGILEPLNIALEEQERLEHERNRLRDARQSRLTWETHPWYERMPAHQPKLSTREPDCSLWSQNKLREYLGTYTFKL